MLPLTLLRTAQGHPMLVELKNGETYNGHLVSCDTWMNLSLREVICTSKDGDRFWKMPECYVRGNNIKYLRIPEEVIDLAPTQEAQMRTNKDTRGGRGGRGRGGIATRGARGGMGGRGGRGGATGDRGGRGGGRGGRGGGGDRGGRGGRPASQ